MELDLEYSNTQNDLSSPIHMLTNQMLVSYCQMGQ